MGCGASVPSQQVVSDAESIAIIGGGIAGVTAGYFLAKKGIHVTIFEKEDDFGNVTSYGPAGVTMWKNVAVDLDWDGGTYSATAGGLAGGIRLATDVVSAGLFAAKEKIGGILGYDEVKDNRKEIMLAARKTFMEFIAEHPEAKDSFDDGGLLYMLSKKQFTKNQELFKDDPSFTFYTKDAFEKSEIYDKLFDGVEYYGIAHSQEEYFVDPSRLTKYIARAVESMGGELRAGTAVEKLSEEDKSVTLQLKAKDGSTEARTFCGCVVALGAWPATLFKASGMDDCVEEIFGLKGYSITGRMPEGILRRGVVDGTDVKFLRPYVDAKGHFCVRFGGCADSYDANDPLKIEYHRMDEFKKNQLAKKLFDTGAKIGETHSDCCHDCIIEEGKIEVWSGVRPVNKNGRMPLYRWVKDSKRVALVSGFGSNGFVMCWHTGPKIAEMIESSADVQPAHT